MKRKEGLVLREVCGENVLVPEGLDALGFRKIISLNDTAAWLWEKAGEQGEFSIGSLTTALCEAYGITPERARTDVQALLDQWLELGIVTTTR